MVFHWSLSDSKSSQISRTLLSILSDLNNALVWTASTRPVISKSSSPCANSLVTLPSAPITIGITVTFMFHSFFNSLARSRYSSLFSHSFSFTQWSAGTAKYTNLQVLFFLLIIIRSFVWLIFAVPFVCQKPRGVCASRSSGEMLACAYTICSSGRIEISCTVPCGSPFPPSRI